MRRRKRLGWYGFVLGCCVLGTAFMDSAFAENTAKTASTQPRLVMVEVDHWRVKFFGLPVELPMLLAQGEKTGTTLRQYDFSAGQEAMDLYLRLRPKSPMAPAYRRFLSKWPLYQQFFMAVDAEEYSKARDLLEQIKVLDPKEPAVFFYLGSLNSQQAQYSAAERDYRQCLKLYPEYGPASINLARLAKARGDNLEARKYLEEAVAHATGPDDVRGMAQKMLESLPEK